MAEHECEQWIVLGCSDSWRGQTQCLYTSTITTPPPSASGVSLSSTRFAAERTASLHPSLPPHRITLHCHQLCFALTLQQVFRGFFQSRLTLISVIVEVFNQLLRVGTSAAVQGFVKRSSQNKALSPWQLCLYLCGYLFEDHFRVLDLGRENIMAWLI